MSEDTQTATDTNPDIKPRSRVVTDGIRRARARHVPGGRHGRRRLRQAPDRRRELLERNHPLQPLPEPAAQGAKEGVHAGGGFPMQFGTISVSDGISMGHEGMHFSLVSREVIADSVETVMQAERIDGSVLLAGCDKSLPGMLMAAARLDLAAVFLYAGSIMPGWVKLEDGSEKEVTLIDAFEASAPAPPAR